MAVVRRRQAPLNINLPNDFVKSKLCSLSALFLIYFDNKAGYAISWKRSLPGVEIEGVVEYKSLPSGVHSIKNDLIYFIHGDHAGLSAFLNVPAAEESRNARMIAVGVMVPLSKEILGRCWEHAEKLKEMANNLIDDTNETKILEDYWEKHKASTLPRKNDMFQLSTIANTEFKSLPNSPCQPISHSRSRSLSDSQLLSTDMHTLSIHHPAWSMVNLLNTFGPLIFPIYRAALLRQRILITTHAPVQEMCNFVYNISVLSSIPLDRHHTLGQNDSSQSLRPLFSVGVHDIPFLEKEFERAKKISNTSSQSGSSKTMSISSRGWIACTTDSILAMKHVLYDVLVRMPPSCSNSEDEKLWPKLESPPGIELKATQRDLRRYKALRSTLSSFESSSQSFARKGSKPSNHSRAGSQNSPISCSDNLFNLPAMRNIIEPVSWSAFAYSNLTWWVSTGERQSESFNESESDALLLSSLSSLSPLPMTFLHLPYTNVTQEEYSNKNNAQISLEMAIVTYFHRMTIQILTTLENVTNTSEMEEEQCDENNPLQGDSENSEYESRTPIIVSSTDVIKMGLDLWSDSDHKFIQNLAHEYIGRRSLIERLRLEMCGIRIC